MRSPDTFTSLGGLVQYVFSHAPVVRTFTACIIDSQYIRRAIDDNRHDIAVYVKRGSLLADC